MSRVLLAVLIIALLACNVRKSEVRRYAFHGKVISVDVPNKSASIANDKVEGWMDAMTMDYPVPDASKLHPGDPITATIVVTDLNYHLENIKSP